MKASVLYANPVGHRVPPTLKSVKRYMAWHQWESGWCTRGAMRGARGALASLMRACARVVLGQGASQPSLAPFCNQHPLPRPNPRSRRQAYGVR